MNKVIEIPPGYYDTAPNYTVERVDEISQSHACTWPACTPEAGEQEPVAWQAVGGSIWGHKTCEDDRPLYTTPARPWVGLTKEEAADCWSNEAVRTWLTIEAALKEKNDQRS